MGSSLREWGVNVGNFVSRELEFGEKSNNYIPWKEQMLCLLESQDLLGFINGEVAPPPSLEKGKMKSEDYVVWRKSERLVKGLILGALSDQLVRKCVKYETARDVWLKLENKFARSTRKPTLPPAAQEQEYYDNLELYKAAVGREWKSNVEADLEAGKSISRTALHVAVCNGKALGLVEKLVRKMSDEDLALRDSSGRTALHIAASTGNTATAKVLVRRLPALLYQQSPEGWFPIHAAARCAHRDTLEWLRLKTEDNLALNPYAGSTGVSLLCLVIDADFYDIALKLVDKYPALARMKNDEFHMSVLESLSLRASAFPSGARFNNGERLIYSYEDFLKKELQKARNMDSFDGHRKAEEMNIYTLLKVFQWVRLLLVWLFKLFLRLSFGPHTKGLYAKKLMHQQAIQLAKCLCKNMAAGFSDNRATVTSIYESAVMTAAGLGIHEVVEAIVETFPDAVYARRDGHYFYQVAAASRCEKVFNLTRDHKHLYSDIPDSSGNNILHLAARLAPPNKLNLFPGAALQMQRELQWFKQVEKFVHPYAREAVNDNGKTPKMVFTEEHKLLKEEGDKWMKDTATSYIIVAALIATVTFAAAIRVPGGNNSSSGYPVFSKSSVFIIFEICDAGSLLTSITSLLMFLSIITSRYAEEDFLYALPHELSTGLCTLFFSIILMMVAFVAAAYMVLGQEQMWVRIAVAALAYLSFTLSSPIYLRLVSQLWVLLEESSLIRVHSY